MQYVQCTVYRIHILCTDGVHIHFCYWIGWKDKHGAWYTKLSTSTSTAENKSSLGLRGQALLLFNLHHGVGVYYVLRTYLDAYGTT